MKLIILMIIFALAVLLTTFTEGTEIEKNSILIENLGEDNLAQHTSRIQQRSILKLFGFKPRYRPVQISLNWRKTNQQRLIKTNYNPINYEISNRRPTNNFLIQKNFIFYNGLNQANNQHNPEIYVPSTSPKYSTSTEYVLLNPTMQQTERTTNFVTSTEATTTFIKQQSTENIAIASTKPTQIYQMTTSTTSKPQTEKPVTINYTTTTTTTVPTLNNNSKSTKGGFTSTSMPQENEFSELIYDIDPRYRKRSVK